MVCANSRDDWESQGGLPCVRRSKIQNNCHCPNERIGPFYNRVDKEELLHVPVNLLPVYFIINLAFPFCQYNQQTVDKNTQTPTPKP